MRGSFADGCEETGRIHEFHGDIVPRVFFHLVDLVLYAHTFAVLV